MEQLYKLEGHKYGVCVLGVNEGQEFLTGSQDGILRLWQKDEQIKEVQAHDHIIREIQPIVGIGYVTCSNDESVKLWSNSLILL